MLGFLGLNPPVFPIITREGFNAPGRSREHFSSTLPPGKGALQAELDCLPARLGQFRQQRNDPAVADIGKHIIREYLGWLDERFQPRSIKRKLATLILFFTFLEQEEIIEASPFRKLRLRLERARSLPRTLSVSSVTRLLQSAYARRARRRPPPGPTSEAGTEAGGESPIVENYVSLLCHSALMTLTPYVSACREATWGRGAASGAREVDWEWGNLEFGRATAMCRAPARAASHGRSGSLRSRPGRRPWTGTPRCAPSAAGPAHGCRPCGAWG